MRPLEQARLEEIADRLGVTYTPLPTPFNKRAVATRMARDFPVPKDHLYALIADVGSHQRFFPHLKALNVITPDMLANAIGPNQVVVVEGLAEGGSKLGVKLFTLTPTDRVEGELMTDPFVSAQAADLVAMHNKKGSIVWAFTKVSDEVTRMEVSSDFEVGPNSAYVRGAIDHVWLDSLENMMVHFGEITPEQKLCAPF